MTVTTRNTIDILIVDDSELVRTGLKTLLDAHTRTAGAQLHLVGQASTANSAVAEASRLKPDVVLMDIRLPDGSGLEACRKILGGNPDTKVLVLTSVIDDTLVYEAMSSGAHGYLLKEINASGLCQAIVDVAAGKFILDPTVTTHVLTLLRGGSNPPTEPDKISMLTPQEQRVLAQVAEGRTNKEIAEQLGLSDKTVKNYLSNIFEKLKISRRSQAAVMYAASRTK